MSNVFNTANKLKKYTVTIGDIELIPNVINSFEMSYSNDSIKVEGELVINDLYDLNLQLIWNNSEVKIMYIDLFEELVEKTFKILNVNERYTREYERIVTFNLQDKFSYMLEKSFLPKSFNGNIIDAINYYITNLGLTDFNTDFTTSTELKPFYISKNINNLEAITIELNKYGFSFFQNKNSIILKSFDDLLPTNLPENDAGKPFMDEIGNQLYKNAIYETIPIFVNKNETPSITRGVAFDISKKTMVYSEYNTIDDFVLNDDTLNIQDNNGVVDVYQNHLNFNDLKNKIKNNFYKQNEITIVVNGYVKNDLNQIYEIKLRGIRTNTDSQNLGNLILSGKWISTKVTDKIVGDSMIQKITLNRADMVKKI